MAIKQRSKSLKFRAITLAANFVQLKVLNGQELVDTRLPSFTEKINKEGHPQLKPTGVDIFQLNIGKLCNQACALCHVDAGPDRTTENMSREDLERCLEIIVNNDIPTVDITGGAPEMNPHFRWFVEALSAHGKKNGSL